VNLFDRLVSIQFTWRDAVDVFVVAVIIYNILALIRGTRAMQVSIGLMLLGSTFFIARAFDLPALEAISREILFYLPFAVIVLFQAEIRRGLARMGGGNPLPLLFGRKGSDIPYRLIVSACEILSSRRIGALIAIEGTQTLRLFEEGAKQLDALVTPELLVSIFTPGGPLHDGAVIVRGNRISAAGAFLPLAISADPLLAHGTRHRAAIGVTEESDAFVIVVSEENGLVAVASEGVLREHVQGDALLAALVERFGGSP
jgi:diadenylate cyclase